MSFCLYFFEERVGVAGVEALVAVHYGYEVVGLREVDDVMGVAGEHVHGFDFVAADLELDDFVGADAALLYLAVAGHDDEELPLCVVPVFAFGDTGLGDVDAHLPYVGTFDQLGEGAAGVDVHLQREGDLLLGQVAEVGAVEGFGEGTFGNFGDDERTGLGLELLEQLYNLTEGHFVGMRCRTVASISRKNSVNSIKLAVVLLTLQGGNHLIYKVVDVEELELYRGVVDLDRQVVGNVVAEGSYGRVVVRAAPFAEEVGEAVYQHLSAGFFGVIEEKLLAGLLALAVGVPGIAADEGCLDGAREHHRAAVAMLFECIEELRGKAEVAFAEVVGILGAVDSGEVEHEVGLAAVAVELAGRGVDVVFKDLVNGEVIEAAVFTLFYGAEVSANEAFGAGN